MVKVEIIVLVILGVAAVTTGSACDSKEDNCYDIFDKKTSKKWSCRCTEEDSSSQDRGLKNTRSADDDDQKKDPCDPYDPPVPDFTSPNRRISTAKCYEYIWELKKRLEQKKREEDCTYKRAMTRITRKRLNEQLQTNNQSTSAEHGYAPSLKYIMGGHDALPAEFPHMGAIGWLSAAPGETWMFKCGGSLISPKFVLTAAHCSQASPRDTTIIDIIPKIVRFGVEDIFENSIIRPSVDRNITKITVHDNYASPFRYFDVALLELDEELPFNKFIHPACLWNGEIENMKELSVTGWGVVKKTANKGHSFLQAAHLDIIDARLCDRLLKPMCSRLFCGLKDHQLCAGQMAGGVDSCQGDSGGPLQRKISLPTNIDTNMYHIVGVTSFGIGCGEKDIPGIYSKVSYFVKWIEDHVWQ